MQADIHDTAVFAKQINHDPFRNTPSDRLLTGLRGKDVLLVFVEAYGQVAVQGSSFSPAIDAAAQPRGPSGCRAPASPRGAAFSPRRRFGGISWLAHSTLQSGRLGQQPAPLQPADVGRTASRSTDAFKRAGWRTVNFAPANDRAWPQGSSVLPLRQDLRPLPGRLSRARASPTRRCPTSTSSRRCSASSSPRATAVPLFAEVDTVSSHMPWNRIPQQIAWNQVGNGSIYNRIPMDHETGAFWSNPATREGGLRPVDRVLVEHPDLVRAALRQEEPRDDRRWATISRCRSSAVKAPITTCRSRSSPTTRRC